MRDRNGSRTGEIETTAHGRIIRDSHGRRLAQYHAHENMTRDSNGNRIGQGDLVDRWR